LSFSSMSRLELIANVFGGVRSCVSRGGIGLVLIKAVAMMSFDSGFAPSSAPILFRFPLYHRRPASSVELPLQIESRG
jgi:hypothetical protein